MTLGDWVIVFLADWVFVSLGVWAIVSLGTEINLELRRWQNLNGFITTILESF